MNQIVHIFSLEILLFTHLIILVIWVVDFTQIIIEYFYINGGVCDSNKNILYRYV